MLISHNNITLPINQAQSGGSADPIASTSRCRSAVHKLSAQIQWPGPRWEQNIWETQFASQLFKSVFGFLEMMTHGLDVQQCTNNITFRSSNARQIPLKPGLVLPRWTVPGCIYSSASDLLPLQCVGKIKTRAGHDSGVSQLPEPHSISSSLTSFFLCHPDGFINKSFCRELSPLAQGTASAQHRGMD